MLPRLHQAAAAGQANLVAAHCTVAHALQAGEDAFGGAAEAPEADLASTGEADFIAALLSVALALLDGGQQDAATPIFPLLEAQCVDASAVRALWALGLARNGLSFDANALLAGIGEAAADDASALTVAVAEAARDPARGRAACARVLATCSDQAVRAAARALADSLLASDDLAAAPF
jgi:hypothetical protein